MSALALMAIISAMQKPPTILLWPNGAPGSEARKNEPEQAIDWWVKNIHNPSITVFMPPKEIATGAAVLVIPGGGHRELVFNPEGVEPAQYLAKHGIVAIALKYRLAREPGSTYKLDEVIQADGYRAMRTIRSHAAEWGVDPGRIGLLAFSAGGEVAARIAYADGNGDPNAADPIDRMNGKPNFQMLVYPGPLYIPAEIPKDAPPAWLLVSNNDGLAPVVIDMLQKYRAAKVSVEAHVVSQDKHGFNMGNRSDKASINTWPQRMIDWLSDNDWLKHK